MAGLDNFIMANGKTATFRRLLLNQCQEEFEKDKKVFVVPVEEKQRMPKDELEQLLLKERRDKAHVFGNMIFIGELFKEKMIAENIMHECVVRLLTAGGGEPDVCHAPQLPHTQTRCLHIVPLTWNVALRTYQDESIECLCKLMTTVGKVLDRPEQAKQMNKYFKRCVLPLSSSPALGCVHRVRLTIGLSPPCGPAAACGRFQRNRECRPGSSLRYKTCPTCGMGRGQVGPGLREPKPMGPRP